MASNKLPKASRTPSRHRAPIPLPEGVTTDQLRWRCKVKKADLPNMADTSIDIGTVGQERGIKALRMGIELNGPGFNIFVCGHAGTGRTAAVKAILRDARPSWSKLRDRCYVNNFKDEDRPRLITLPPGRGRTLKLEMDELITLLKKHIPAACEEEGFATRKSSTVEKFQNFEKELFAGFEEKLKENNFVLGQVQEGNITRQELFPIIDGKPYALGQLDELIASGRLSLDDVRNLNELYSEFQPEFVTLFKKRRLLAREMLRVISEIEQEAVRPVVQGLIDDMNERFEEEPIRKYLIEVRDAVLADLTPFKDHEEAGEDGTESDDEGRSKEPEDLFAKFRVNVLLDNTEADKPPVIVETSPTFSNMFGSVEKVERHGTAHADFRGIKAGSLLRGDGGFIILNCTDVLSEPSVWNTLKRVLRYRKLEIQAPETQFQPTPVPLKPEPISLSLKVIMIGSPETFALLNELDDEFDRIFKVKSEFDSEMKCTKENLDHYFRVVGKITTEEKLRPFKADALGELAEYGMRRGGRQGRLTTHFSDVADVLRESDYLARMEGSRDVGRTHLLQALKERYIRTNLLEGKLQEMLDDGLILIDTRGEHIGQINGLWVYDLGSCSFGRPARITASTSPGEAGVINVEREVSLSGASHDKGVLIISGYLRRKFARDFPLGLTATICFEQSYSGVDGDSASLAEVLAIQSDLAGIPIRQCVAVTGSVNQMGEVQAVGGVNEKVEGFFRVCRRRGLTGRQGVVMPASNIKDLMLDHEVLEAVANGKFHVWPVKTVDEAVEIVTGHPAGSAQAHGQFPDGTFNHFVSRRLLALAHILSHFGRHGASSPALPAPKGPQARSRARR